MKIDKIDTFLANTGGRNLYFVKVRTDGGDVCLMGRLLEMKKVAAHPSRSARRFDRLQSRLSWPTP